MQAAVGKVQLTKLDKMLESNKARYLALEESMGESFNFREIPLNSKIIHDCLIFEDSSIKRKQFVELLNTSGFGTKNLPDAITGTVLHIGGML